jgi:hypothetical protein
VILHFLQQAVQSTPVQHEVPGFMRKVLDFLDTPAPYSPFTEYLFILFVLWLLARRKDTKDFSAEAQQVLEEKFKKGEIDKKTYDKYRQELSMRIKKE